MLLRMLLKSLKNRKTGFSIALLAVIIGAAVPTAMFTVTRDVERNVGIELRGYGANLLLVPKSDTIRLGLGTIEFGSITEQSYINESDIPKIKTIHWEKNILGYAPFLYQVVTANADGEEQRIVLVGTWFERDTLLEDGRVFTTGVRSINTWWDVEGGWIDDRHGRGGDRSEGTVREENVGEGTGGGEGRAGMGDGQSEGTRGGRGRGTGVEESMIGIDVARILGLGIGDRLDIYYHNPYEKERNATLLNLTVTGIINSGGPEDTQILIPLETAQRLTDRTGLVHTVQVSALCSDCPIEMFVSEIEGTIPYVEAKTVRQVANAEMRVLEKIGHMMILITILALFSSALGIGTTMTTSIIGRRKEIGLMKSIGAENWNIAALFLSEAMFIGVLGSTFGYILGILLAKVIGRQVFDTSVTAAFIVFPIILALSLAVVFLASVLPVRQALRIEPAVVLKGE